MRYTLSVAHVHVKDDDVILPLLESDSGVYVLIVVLVSDRRGFWKPGSIFWLSHEFSDMYRPLA